MQESARSSLLGCCTWQKYLESIKTFQIKAAFPNFETHPYHFRVDPYENQRVWFTTRGTGVHIPGRLTVYCGSAADSQQHCACNSNQRPLPIPTQTLPLNLSERLQVVMVDFIGQVSLFSIGKHCDGGSTSGRIECWPNNMQHG